MGSITGGTNVQRPKLPCRWQELCRQGSAGSPVQQYDRNIHLAGVGVGLPAVGEPGRQIVWVHVECRHSNALVGVAGDAIWRVDGGGAGPDHAREEPDVAYACLSELTCHDAVVVGVVMSELILCACHDGLASSCVPA